MGGGERGEIAPRTARGGPRPMRGLGLHEDVPLLLWRQATCALAQTRGSRPRDLRCERLSLPCGGLGSVHWAANKSQRGLEYSVSRGPAEREGSWGNRGESGDRASLLNFSA